MGGRGVSRRDFLKGVGIATTVTVSGAPPVVLRRLRVLGPGVVPVRLRVNGRDHEIHIEPRVTLLDALRDRIGLTGSKKICDRGSCGGCVVLLDGRPVVSCMMLAVDAQGAEIRTVEGIAPGSALADAFVQEDALQCGFCTAGMLVSAHASLAPAGQDGSSFAAALAGNICRCGTYPRVVAACRRAAGQGERR